MLDAANLTEATRIALGQLRQSGDFQWPIVYILILTGYIYANEVQHGRWNVVAAGLALWFADWINELLNAAFLHLNGVAPLWVETGRTSYQILVGLNIETTFLFLIYGMVYAKTLPADRHARLFGMNNRLALALVVSVFSVVVEIVLNRIDVLNWHWTFWNIPWGLPLIVVFGYVWFFLAAAWAHDAPDAASRVRRVGALAGTAAALGIVFGALGWL